jgi:serine/threonine-protein phosphatase 2B regulatory subunit
MGVFGSKVSAVDVVAFLSEEELEEVKIGSCFTRTEIKNLYNRFSIVDLDGNNTLDVDEFLQFPEFRLNPMAYRLTELLDRGKTGSITFRDFIRVMSAFSPAAQPQDKHQLAFQLYDLDDDGKISKDDLAGALKMTVSLGEDPNQLTEKGLAEVVDHTFDEMVPGQTHIEFEDFVKVVTLPGCELLSKMTMQF